MRASKRIGVSAIREPGILLRADRLLMLTTGKTRVRCQSSLLGNFGLLRAMVLRTGD
jgi:hypothetical protein